MPPSGSINNKSTYVLGVDLARLGEDESVFTVIEKPPWEDTLYVVFIDSMKHGKLTQAIARILFLDHKFNFTKILVDSTGLGAAVADVVKQELKYKVEDVTFTMQSKQSMYNNLKYLMERGKIKLPHHKKLYYQLCDMQYVIAKNNKDIKLHHPPRGHDDYPDSLALAAYYFKNAENTYVPTII